jgi:gliding motility-associatede transport system auxiliary component
MIRRIRAASISAAAIAAVLALLVAANVLASRSAQSWDLTRAGNNTLAPQSVLAARRLSSDLQVVGLFHPAVGNGQSEAEALVALYEAQSPHVKYRSADPDKDPVDVKRYGITQVNTLVLDYKGKTELLLQSSQTESDFTSALLKLESDKVPMVCWGVGDGERDLNDSNQSTGYSGVAALLDKNNFAHQELLLASTTVVPAECDELVILDPTKALPAQTVKAVETYLAAGGRMLIAAEPWARDPTATTSLNTLLRPYGLGFTGALVVETDPSRYPSQNPTVPGVIAYGQSPITGDIQNIVSYFPQTTAITGSPASGAQAVRLASTSNGAYAIAGIRSDLARQSADASGPFTVMETVEQPAGAGKTRIVVVGTPAFAQNGTLPPINTDANLELALGSFQWLAGQDALIAVPPKPDRALPLSLSQDEQSTLIFITAVLMPGLIVLAGVVVWWRRRVFV